MSAHKTRTQSMAICWLLGATLAACGGATSDDTPMDTDAPGDNSPGNADTGNADTGSGLQDPSQDAGGAPAPEPTGPARYTQISANNGHTCALTTAGGIRCWGENDFGESDAPNGEGFVHVSAGTQHSCAIRDDGSVECWGDRPSIGRTPEGSFVQLSASLGATCAIRDDATLACWGDSFAESDGVLEVPEGSYTWVSTCA